MLVENNKHDVCQNHISNVLGFALQILYKDLHELSIYSSSTTTTGFYCDVFCNKNFDESDHFLITKYIFFEFFCFLTRNVLYTLEDVKIML